MDESIPVSPVQCQRLPVPPEALAEQCHAPEIVAAFAFPLFGGYLTRINVKLAERCVIRPRLVGVAKLCRLPTGYRLEWSGQYEAMQRAAKRLRVVVPITLLIIFGLLYFNFRSTAESLIVMASLPFALAGGVWLMWILRYNLSVAVAIGFIALAGVAAQTAVVLLIYLDQAWNHTVASARQAGSVPTRNELDAAVEFGSVERLRPKMMTVAAITLSLVPILWSQQTGSDVLKRIAAPMVGGLITSAGLTLMVLPAIYSLWRERELRRVAVQHVDLAPVRTGLAHLWGKWQDNTDPS
jgi:Cu/Ag efflux pump CusA